MAVDTTDSNNGNSSNVGAPSRRASASEGEDVGFSAFLELVGTLARGSDPRSEAPFKDPAIESKEGTSWIPRRSIRHNVDSPPDMASRPPREPCEIHGMDLADGSVDIEKAPFADSSSPFWRDEEDGRLSIPMTETSSTNSAGADQTREDPNQLQDIEAQTKSTEAELTTSNHSSLARLWHKNKIQPDTTGQLPSSDSEAELTASNNLRLARLWYRKKIQPFWKITVAQIFCVIYILVLTFSYPPVGMADPSTNDIIDPNSVENTENGVIYVNGSYRPVVAIGSWQKFCLAISRMSAFSMYPMMVVAFVTKMKALQSFFARTPLSIYLGMVKEGHDYHVHAGRYIAFDVWLHTLFHLLRWGSHGNIELLWTSAAGITGLITVIATPLICLPMMYCKERIRYEVRKGLHYLFYVFAVAMCFHVPVTAMPNGGFLAPVLGTCIVAYTLDAAYVFLFMTERIETTAFHVLSPGVRISMPTSERFRRRAGRGGYAYINLTWIDDRQWHAFSLFEDPADPGTQQMFLMKNGDWTDAVHRALSRDTTRPCWINGPFPSPYGHASLYDNQILVASGIGITPALATINAFKSSRRVNLIWAVRDPEMLEFFLQHMYLDHDGWNLIFYTGKKPLAASVENMNTNVKVIKGRPQLRSVIPNVIYGIESGEGLPEKYTEGSKEEMKRRLTQRVSELDEDFGISATEKVAKLREYGDFLGFSLDEFVEEIDRSHDGAGLVESFLGYNPKSSAAEDRAEDLMASLKSLVATEEDCVRSYYKKQSNSSDLSMSLSEIVSGDLRGPPSRRSSVKMSLSEIAGGDPREPLCRRGSMRRWTAVRNVVDEGDPGSLLTPAFCPWVECEMQERSVKKLDDDVMTTWGMMYCGGSKPVIASLREISIDYNIDLHIDSFAW